LQEDVAKIVGVKLTRSRREVFEDVRALARQYAGRPQSTLARPIRASATVPYLNEPWYC